ncbi:alpha beta hydrolase fold family [Fusarium subglutinans]|uniref:Alpha beta hydrolase fold family n=1 Tax=Gibberella subglutinans TaxID=42677 RepID=A0A8H5P118_GIBSU|nr:alpha beta hydrolase fold family [Fusarium subglutinans]KAF5586956.1 alpha beta hydrolase fold family [Fusarium subglutinans]
MIGTSFGEWVFIRLSIAFFRYTPLIYIFLILFLPLVQPVSVVFPFRLKRDADHPPALSRQDRNALFERCFGNVPSLEIYLRWWFLDADPNEIRRENVREFMLWAFFERGHGSGFGDDEETVEEEVEHFLSLVEQRLGRKFEEGWGNVKSLRLTIDGIMTTYRSLVWYIIVFFLDQATHFAFRWHGFDFHRRPRSSALRVFPPRPQELFPGPKSPSTRLSYWHRPHTAEDKLPVVFFHGIGIGLWTYVRFLAGLHKTGDGNGSVGVIALEILPISFRLTPAILDKAEFLAHMTSILEHHCWHKFALVSHSYGSVLTTHMLHEPSFQHRVPSVVLIDPVTIMLHLPEVAYNFTRRQPRRANEWQLWYFASTDPGVALCLGRHFFWRENILWKEDLLGTQSDGHPARHVAVTLSGRDLIVDTTAVAEYLGVDLGNGRSGMVAESHNGVEVVMFPKLDHAQVFDDRWMVSQE